MDGARLRGSAMETVWTPLLKGKFDRHYNSVSMAWLWARIHIRANSRGPGGGRENSATSAAASMSSRRRLKMKSAGAA